jgi:Tetracyclin repressor-like, C-terminal domain
VDPALVHHFFGTKERLFAAAMRLPLIPGEMIDAALAPGARNPAQSLGEHLVRTVLGAWDVTELRDMFLGLLRSAVTSEQAAAMLREFVTESILGRIAEVAVPSRAAGADGPAATDGTADPDGTAGADGPADPDGTAGADGPVGAEMAAEASYRAALVASQVVGLALARYVLGLEPLATASQDDLAAAIGPTLERYLTGTVR